jgi:hypothetical protein
MYKYVLIFITLSLNFFGLSGQAVHFDYNDSGNRESRYIDLKNLNDSLSDAMEKSSNAEDSKGTVFEDVLEEATIKIYPNPTAVNLNIEITGIVPDIIISYQLFSQSGTLIQSNNNTGNQFSVELSNHPSGLYILKLMVNGKVSDWKIIKQ